MSGRQEVEEEAAATAEVGHNDWGSPVDRNTSSTWFAETPAHAPEPHPFAEEAAAHAVDASFPIAVDWDGTDGLQGVTADTEPAARGWASYTDGDGHVYYYNHDTGESTYDAPAEFGLPAASASAGGAMAAEGTTEAHVEKHVPAGDGVDSTLSGWHSYVDDQGYTYYYNHDTHESQYEAPGDAIAGGSQEQQQPQQQPQQQTPLSAPDKEETEEASAVGGTQQQQQQHHHHHPPPPAKHGTARSATRAAAAVVAMAPPVAVAAGDDDADDGTLLNADDDTEYPRVFAVFKYQNMCHAICCETPGAVLESAVRAPLCLIACLVTLVMGACDRKWLRHSGVWLRETVIYLVAGVSLLIPGVILTCYQDFDAEEDWELTPLWTPIGGVDPRRWYVLRTGIGSFSESVPSGMEFTPSEYDLDRVCGRPARDRHRQRVPESDSEGEAGTEQQQRKKPKKRRKRKRQKGGKNKKKKKEKRSKEEERQRAALRNQLNDMAGAGAGAGAGVGVKDGSDGSDGELHSVPNGKSNGLSGARQQNAWRRPVEHADGMGVIDMNRSSFALSVAAAED